MRDGLTHQGNVRSGLPVIVLIACAYVTLAATPSRAQVSPDEHAAHHAGQRRGPWADGGAEGQTPGGAEGAMQGMETMMERMHAPPSKELYPSLIAMPELTPERRQGLLDESRQRMREGTSMISQGIEHLAQAVQATDYLATQQATSQMREGMARLESGLATQRAIAEGTAPRDIALTWFKREMDLLPAAGVEHTGEILGLSWFHFFSMVLLTGFAAVMLWMYFFKMRRAAQLLQGLTGGAPLMAVGAEPSPQGRAVPPMTASPTPAPMQKWSGKLRISRVFQETPDVKTFRLMNPLGGALPFSYLPGQYLTLTVLPDGQPVRRSYTIASSPTQHDYVEITVKHEESGVVSGYLHTRAQPGDLLDCAGPSGSFTFTGRECKCILLIAGGVGITPLMSVLRYLTDRSWPGDIFLLYACSKPQDVIFREELDYLQRRHPSLRVVISVSHPEGTDWKGPTGRMTKELIVQSVPDVVSRYVHICGPVSMMEAVKKMLAELGVPRERIRTEAFGPALGKPEPIQAAAAAPVGTEAREGIAAVAGPTVSFSLSDKSAPIPADKTVLDIADEIGVEIDNSCRMGTCGTCRVKLLSGEVTMAVEDGLEPGDKERGIILACQAKSQGNVTVEA